MSELQQLLLNQREEEKASKSSFNAEQRIDYFRSIVSELYTQIKNEWLKDLADEDLIRFADGDVELEESGLGTYTIDTLIIHTPIDNVEFVPTGTLLIGTDGGIEVRCNDQCVNLVHIEEKIENQGQLVALQIGKVKMSTKDSVLVWKIMHEDENHLLHFTTLDQNSMQKLLINLLSDESR